MPQVVVVTGASRGLGLELVRQLAERGDRVIATVRSPEGASALERLPSPPERIETLDVADAPGVAALATNLRGLAIDVLINNAGKGGGRQAFDQLDTTELASFFEVNSIGPMRVAQALLPNLRAGRRRLVASVSSRMGSIDDNTSGGAYGYRASKTALNMFNKSLSIDLAREKFTCVVLHPGWVKTDMGGEGAPLQPAESVAGMLKVLDGLRPTDTGRFLDFEGQPIPW